MKFDSKSGQKSQNIITEEQKCWWLCNEYNNYEVMKTAVLMYTFDLLEVLF